MTQSAVCLEPDCESGSEPIGVTRIVGHDQDGNAVWMQRWRCFQGHRYDVELPALSWNGVWEDE